MVCCGQRPRGAHNCAKLGVNELKIPIKYPYIDQKSPIFPCQASPQTMVWCGHAHAPAIPARLVMYELMSKKLQMNNLCKYLFHIPQSTGSTNPTFVWRGLNIGFALNTGFTKQCNKICHKKHILFIKHTLLMRLPFTQMSGWCRIKAEERKKTT